MGNPGKDDNMPALAKPKRVQRRTASKPLFPDPEMIPERWRIMVNPGTQKCKRCGSADVTWQTSKTGKYYLTEVFMSLGDLFTGRLEFHSKYCGKPELHAKMQVEYGIEAEQKMEDAQ